jgi:hypothetical protein
MATHGPTNVKFARKTYKGRHGKVAKTCYQKLAEEFQVLENHIGQKCSFQSAGHNIGC